MKAGVLKGFPLFMVLLMLYFYCDASLCQHEQQLKFSIKTISRDDPTLKTNLQIPVLEGLNEEAIQDRINRKIEEDIFTFRDELAKSSERCLEIADKIEWDQEQCIGETIFELHYLSGKIISFSIIYYSYTLGAHGYTEQKSYNFDLKTGLEITVQDLFDGYDHYEEVINQEIKHQIAMEKEIYFNEGKDFQSIRNNQPFYIQYDGIVVYFGLYELAPYAEGIRCFKIPFSIFSGLKSEHLPYFTLN